MQLFKAMATVAGLTGISRILGFIRDVLSATLLGAGPVADAFFVALKLPNFFRRITAEGAFSVAFIPLYAETLKQDSQEQANHFAAQTFIVMLTFLVPFTLLILWAMPWIIYAIAPGFHGDAIRYDLAIELSLWTFPYLLFMSLCALLGGVLNAHEKFAPFAAAPIFFNLCLIAGLLMGGKNILPDSTLPTTGHALAIGIFMAGIIQLLWMLYFFRRHGGRLKLMRPKMTPDIKKLLMLMGPGVIGAGVMHINLFADLIIASMLETGAISYLYYADRLNQLPLGMVGIAVGTALLPMLSGAIAQADKAKASHLFNRALELCLLFSMPAAAALMVMPDIIIGGLFQYGEFTQKDTDTTMRVLQAYAIGLPAYIVVKTLSTVYWSNQNTKTPVKISIIATICNIALSLALIIPLGVVGIALATGLMGWIQCFFLYHGLSKNKDYFIGLDQQLKRNIRKITLACIIMIFALIAGKIILISLPPFMILAILVLVGIVIYSSVILATKMVTLGDLKQYFKRASS